MPQINLFGLLALGLLSSSVVGQESLFDGKTLNGWKGDPQVWSVEDGAITGKNTAENPIKGNTFLIWGGELADFELNLKFRIEGGNSGIQFRSKDLGEYHVGGYQADIDSGMRFMGILYDEDGRGVLCERGHRVTWNDAGKESDESLEFDEESFRDSLKQNDWNTYIVRAEGNRITQTINGRTVVEFTDNDQKQRDPKGILAFQVHVGPAMKIQFKDVQLTRLAPNLPGKSNPAGK